MSRTTSVLLVTGALMLASGGVAWADAPRSVGAPRLVVFAPVITTAPPPGHPARFDCRRPGVTRICFYDLASFRGAYETVRCDGWTQMRFADRHRATSIINKCRRAYRFSGRPGNSGRAPLRTRTVYPLQWVADLGGSYGMDNLNETLVRG